ncbi:hypothetical protein PtrCC142_012188, partial [Pyrenophora tritici-repentis]
DFEKLERQLIKLYSLRQMGNVKWFLGIRVERVLASRQLYLVQDAFINKVCTEFDLIRSDGRYPSTPLSSTSRLLPYDGVARGGEPTQTFATKINSTLPTFFGAADASFGDDVETRRSSAGYVFMLYGMPVDWKATVLRSVTRSTTEAELYALSAAG